MRRWFALLCAAGLAAVPATAMPPGADAGQLRAAAHALHEMRVEAADEILRGLARRYPDDPDVLFEQGMVRFYRGDYAGARGSIEAAGERGRLRSARDRRELAALVQATSEATAGFVRAASNDGRYVVHHAEGADALLVPYALDAMREADRRVGEELGIRVPGPIRLEIFPSAASLAEVSTLSVAEIETTGTIALCKWDRLMITSPRALVRGYPWLDTVGHELVHLLLTRSSRDRAPVWLQEGVAKFLERRWRGEAPSAHLDLASAALLRSAARRGQLLPFDRLHPSIARLPSQRDAALAFAQVATFIEGFYREHGADGLRSAIAQMAGGTDATEALASVAGHPWSELERRWRSGLSQRLRPVEAPPRLIRRRLRVPGRAVNDESDVEVDRARRHLRLGDLLWDRRRPAAAAAQYGRAHRAAPDDPIVAGRYARAALRGGRPQEALGALRLFRDRYPDHAPTWAISGAAWLALGNRARAAGALREAIRLNPFDPEPHCGLMEASENQAERTRERSACRSLRRMP